MLGHSMSNLACAVCGDLDGCHLPAKIRDDRLSLREFWDHHSFWSQQTFGLDSARGPEGPLKHLEKEAREALEKPKDIMEYADCLFLVFDACRRAGFTYEDLRKAVNQKLKINKARKWGSASATEAVEHIRD